MCASVHPEAASQPVSDHVHYITAKKIHEGIANKGVGVHLEVDCLSLLLCDFCLGVAFYLSIQINPDSNHDLLFILRVSKYSGTNERAGFIAVAFELRDQRNDRFL